MSKKAVRYSTPSQHRKILLLLLLLLLHLLLLNTAISHGIPIKLSREMDLGKIGLQRLIWIYSQ
jgi:hypothetical protein